jgi:hypothetical protein
VAVEGPPEKPREEYVKEKKRLGIQFTTNMLPEVLKHKQKQISRARGELHAGRGEEYVTRPVDSIVLVAVPMKECTNAFLKWEDDGRPPGGPEQYLKAGDRVVLVQAMLQGRVKLEDKAVKDLVTREKTQAK